MIEALVALLVLALGVMGLARLQVGALTESRNTNARAMAVHLAADLSERMQSNSAIRRDPPAVNPYATGWGVPGAAGADCLTTTCTGAELAAFDVRALKLNLQTLLPGGDAQIFQSDTDQNQFGVLIGWTNFEAKNEAVSSNADQLLYTAADAVTDGVGAIGTGVAAAVCPAQLTCHLVYIRP